MVKFAFMLKPSMCKLMTTYFKGRISSTGTAQNVSNVPAPAPSQRLLRSVEATAAAIIDVGSLPEELAETGTR